MPLCARASRNAFCTALTLMCVAAFCRWQRSDVAASRVAIAGSLVVIAAGVYWFIERVFFPEGIL